MAKLNKIQRLYLSLIQDELKDVKPVVFENHEEPGNRCINCPGTRAAKIMDQFHKSMKFPFSKPARCPFDTRTTGCHEWGCFEHCSMFKGEDNITLNVNPGELGDVNEKISGLLK